MYLSRRPKPPLDAWVECLWLISDEPAGGKERIPPSDTIDLGVNLRENTVRIYDAVRPEASVRHSGAVVSGTRRAPVVIDTNELVSVMGVRFRPGRAFPFLRRPAVELADTHVDLDVLWGSAAHELREQLCLAETSEERFTLLEQALVARLRHAWEPHYAVRFALERLGRGGDERPAIREVVRQTGLSQRRFIQLFAREVGMAPKLFCRVRRFRHVLERLRRAPSAEWARLAAECGYYDQSHLIHDFRSFAHLSPTEFMRLQSECAVRNHATVVQ